MRNVIEVKGKIYKGKKNDYFVYNNLFIPKAEVIEKDGKFYTTQQAIDLAKENSEKYKNKNNDLVINKLDKIIKLLEKIVENL